MFPDIVLQVVDLGLCLVKLMIHAGNIALCLVELLIQGVDFVSCVFELGTYVSDLKYWIPRSSRCSLTS